MEVSIGYLVSHHNHHDQTALDYVLSLHGYISCSKKHCPGKLIPVLVKYQQITEQGVITSTERELECCVCGKIAKGEAILHRLERQENSYREPYDPRSKLPKVGNIRGQRGKERKKRKRQRQKQLANFAKKRKQRAGKGQ